MWQRAAQCLAGLWAGMLLGLGGIGAPAGFAVAPVEVAGRSAGRMFAIEAHLSLIVAVVLLLLIRKTAPASDGPASLRVNTHLFLVLGALLCTVVGYFVLQPMMADARAGLGSLSFGALHGLSAGLFALKGLLALWLAWRLTAR